MKTIKIAICTVAALMLSAGVLFNLNPLRASIYASAPIMPQKVIIDAGHGGFDGGAITGENVMEKDLNLSIALKLDETLKLYGFTTILTRRTDQALGSSLTSQTTKQKDLNRRVEIMRENPDAIFVSIHQNKFEQESVYGFQTFYGKDESSKLLAEEIQALANSDLIPENLKLSKADTRDIFILKNAEIPAVVVECGFMSNKKELKKLTSEDYQSSLAFTIANGIFNYIYKNKVN